MAHSAIAADLRQTLDVELHLAAQVTLGRELAHLFTDALHFRFGQVAHARVRVDARRLQNLFAGGTANAVNIS